MPRFAHFLVTSVLISTAALAAAGPLPTGVAAGDVSQTEATLWAKATAAGTVTFQLSRSPGFGSAVTATKNVSDPAVPIHQDLTGLLPGTRYFYRATDAAGNASQGTFVTPHANGRHGLRFGVSGDWRNELAPYVANANVDERSLDFFVALGDTSYTDRASPTGPGATTLADFRAKHAEQLTPRAGINTLVEVRQSTAVFAMIDDHEVRNDFAGAAMIGSDPRFLAVDPGRPNDLINTSTLYRNGLQAFQDYMPIQQRIVSGTGDPRAEGRPDLYRSQRYGTDAQVIIPDARSFRDQGLGEELSQIETLQQAFAPGRTMLGRFQVDRLKSDLLAAQKDGVTWKFVMVPEPIQNLGPVNAFDRYEGYAAERTELLKFIRTNDITNVVFVSADLHGTVMNNLTYQEVNSTNPALSFLGPQIKVKSFEVVTGPGAFPTPFGPTVVELARALGRIGDAEVAYYASLPIAPDRDALLNDKDDFVAKIINDLMAPLGYSPLGLEDSDISFDLMSGDWVMAHLFGWTEFEIDQVTQNLLVTTWGLRFTDVLEALAAGDTGRLALLSPQIFGQLLVRPDLVPEPAALGLLALGAGVLLLQRKRGRAPAAGRSL